MVDLARAKIAEQTLEIRSYPSSATDSMSKHSLVVCVHGRWYLPSRFTLLLSYHLILSELTFLKFSNACFILETNVKLKRTGRWLSSFTTSKGLLYIWWSIIWNCKRFHDFWETQFFFLLIEISNYFKQWYNLTTWTQSVEGASVCCFEDWGSGAEVNDSEGSSHCRIICFWEITFVGSLFAFW